MIKIGTGEPKKNKNMNVDRIYEILVVVVICLISISIAIAIWKFGNTLDEKEIVDKVQKQKRILANVDTISIEYFLDKYKIKNPKVVMAQAIIETGNFTGRIYADNNNVFSMRLPKSRPTTAIGEQRGYAVYSSIEHSIIDYAMYQARIRTKAMTDEQYIKLLQDSCYAVDEEYTNKLKQLIK